MWFAGVRSRSHRLLPHTLPRVGPFSLPTVEQLVGPASAPRDPAKDRMKAARLLLADELRHLLVPSVPVRQPDQRIVDAAAHPERQEHGSVVSGVLQQVPAVLVWCPDLWTDPSAGDRGVPGSGLCVW